jgi:hypothetical protein
MIALSLAIPNAKECSRVKRLSVQTPFVSSGADFELVLIQSQTPVPNGKHWVVLGCSVVGDQPGNPGVNDSAVFGIWIAPAALLGGGNGVVAQEPLPGIGIFDDATLGAGNSADSSLPVLIVGNPADVAYYAVSNNNSGAGTVPGPGWIAIPGTNIFQQVLLASVVPHSAQAFARPWAGAAVGFRLNKTLLLPTVTPIVNSSSGADGNNFGGPQPIPAGKTVLIIAQWNITIPGGNHSSYSDSEGNVYTKIAEEDVPAPFAGHPLNFAQVEISVAQNVKSPGGLLNIVQHSPVNPADYAGGVVNIFTVDVGPGPVDQTPAMDFVTQHQMIAEPTFLTGRPNQSAICSLKNPYMIIPSGYALVGLWSPSAAGPGTLSLNYEYIERDNGGCDD